MSHNQAFFEPDSITARVATFEATLGLVDHTGLAVEIVAKKILELVGVARC
jgi:hypothetical protein